MKSLKTKILLPLLAWGLVASADTDVAPANGFEKVTDPIAADVGTYWHNLSGAERAKFTEGEKTANPILSATEYDIPTRADDFIGTHYALNEYYFKVNSGTEVIFRTFLPNLDDSEDANHDGVGYQVQQVEISGTEVVYLDALVKFVHSPEPEPGDDKLIIWADSSGRVRVTAGRYKASLAASGVETVHYVTTTNGTSELTVTDGTWHRVAVKFFRPLKLDYYNSGFVVYVDGNPLAVLGEKIVADDLLTTFKEYLTDEGRMEYEAGTLFPTRRIDASTQKLTGLGMSGTGGGVDEIVLSTNSTPNVISNYKPEIRHLILAYEAGLTSFTYEINNIETSTTVTPNGLRGETVIPLYTPASNPSIPNPSTITIGNVFYADDYQSHTLVGDEGDVTVSGDDFTVLLNGNSGIHGKIEVSKSPSFSVCQLDYGDTHTTCTSIQAAVDELAEQSTEYADATITLLRSWDETVVVTNTVVTLDLAGRTLTGTGLQTPTISVGINGSLTVADSVGGGKIVSTFNVASLSRNNNARDVILQGGDFLDPVVNSRYTTGDYSTYNLIFQGGRYFANGSESEMKLYGGSLNTTTYTAAWDSVEKCWVVAKQAVSLGLGRSLELATTAALLGMSPAGSAQMQQLDADPEIIISDIATSVVDARTVVDCLVTITLAGEPVEVASVSLAGLVRVSKDLATWETPSNITYESTETPGVYRVRMTLPDAANYFIRLSDK